MTRSVMMMLVAVVLGMPAAAGAAPVIFYGIDSGVSSVSPRPNADAAAGTFDAAVAALGQQEAVIDFEALPISQFATSTTIDSGVELSLAGAPYGRITNSTGIPGIWNTTSGGENYFLWRTEAVNPGETTSTTATFSFVTAVDAFGAYFTGIGRDATVSMNFFDGTVRTFPVPGAGIGTDNVLFFGFVDSNAPIMSIALTNTFTSPVDFGGPAIYVVGVDDVRYATTSVPEPGTLGLLGLGLAGLSRTARGRRRA